MNEEFKNLSNKYDHVLVFWTMFWLIFLGIFPTFYNFFYLCPFQILVDIFTDIKKPSHPKDSVWYDFSNQNTKWKDIGRHYLLTILEYRGEKSRERISNLKN